MAKNGKEKNEKAPAVKRPEYKFGVHDLAEILEVKPTSVRVALRKNKIPKAEGNIYGWNTKSDMDSVVKQIQKD